MGRNSDGTQHTSGPNHGRDKAQEWQSKNEQQNATGQSSSICILDWGKLSNAPNTVNRYTGDLYDRESGSYAIHDLEYITSSVSYDSYNVPEYLDNLNLNGYEIALDVRPYRRFALPYNNIFFGFNPNHPAQFDFYKITDWERWTTTNDAINYKYSIGSTTLFPPYSNWDFCSFSFIAVNVDGVNFVGWIQYQYSANKDRGAYYWVLVNQDKIINLLGSFERGDIPIPDPEKGFPSEEGGGTPDITTRDFDEIPTPDLPTIGVSTSGLFNVYKMTQHSLRNFAQQLFRISTRHPYEGGDLGDEISNVLNHIDLGLQDALKGNLTEFVIDTHIIPVNPQGETNVSNIYIGGYTLTTTGYKVTNDHVAFSCGVVDIPNKYGGFEDFLTKYKLFLPFIGFVDVNPNYATSKLKIDYHFNVIDGSCIAYLSSQCIPNSDAFSVVASYSGSCCVHMPITGSNYSNVISGLIQGTSAIATGVSTGNPLSALGGAINGIGTIEKGNFSLSNAYNSSTGYMGIRRPFVLVERPARMNPTSYAHTFGRYLNATKKLSTLRGTGLTKCVNVNMDAFENIKTSEKNEIKRLLESGVYL